MVNEPEKIFTGVQAFGYHPESGGYPDLFNHLLAMTRVILIILVAIGLVGCRPSSTADQAVASKAQFVFVRIPEQIQPVERGAKYEDPLDAVLKKERVGEVSGGGTQLSAPDANGKKNIEWVGVDVDLTDFEKGMPILKRELLRLGAPAATLLEYKRDDKGVEEKLQ